MIVCAHLSIAVVLIGIFSGRRLDPENGDDWIAQSDGIRDLLVGVICLIISILMFVICCIGCLAVCCRCCVCLFILFPVTLVVAVFMFAVGSISERLEVIIEGVCDEFKDDMQDFWTGVIDVPMCSDLCPCSAA